MHFEHFPGNDDFLAVFYSPATIEAGILPYYKRTASLSCGRLLINPGTNNFYQDCVGELEELIATVSNRYRNTIHYGFSMGGYASLRFGAPDPKCVATFAIAPTLVLSRKHTRSDYLMRMSSVIEENDDVRLFTAKSKAKFFCFFSCLDVLDGINIADSTTLGANAQCYFYNEQHQLHSINHPETMVGDFLSGRPLASRPDLFANPREIEASKIAYDLRLSVMHSRNLSSDAEKFMAWRKQVRGSSLLLWAGKNLLALRRFAEALPFFLAALDKDRNAAAERTLILESIALCVAAPEIAASAEAIRSLAD